MKYILFLLLGLFACTQQDEPCEDLVTLTTERYSHQWCSDDLHDLQVDTIFTTYTLTRCEAEERCRQREEAHFNTLTYWMHQDRANPDVQREVYFMTEWPPVCKIE